MPEPSKRPPSKKEKSFWLRLVWMGLGERFLQIGSAIVTILLLFIILWVTGVFFLKNAKNRVLMHESDQAPTPMSHSAVLPYYNPAPPQNDLAHLSEGIFRSFENETSLPARPRKEVQKYIVQANDTVIGIAEKFNLKPSTILWGNPYTLSDDPHRLRVGQEINILPIDGAYYEWHDGDGLNGVSSVYKVTPEDIIDYPTNDLNMNTIGEFSHPNISTGVWLVIPGGRKDFISWSAPYVTRENPAVATIYGPGACQAVFDGLIGTGTFVWPAVEKRISGYDYNEESNHRAIDIGGILGTAIYAADSGVVVYAGWNDWGYGNVVMIDHGNGWQTLYAHLDSYNVACGQSVGPGEIIAALGTTGNSSGPHLHYEMRYNGVPQNPHNFY